MTYVRLAAAFLVLAYVVFFVIRNLEPVQVDLLVGTFGPVPISVVVLCSTGLGALCAGIALAWPMTQARVQSRRDARRIAQLEQEIHGLRTLPLAETVHEMAEDVHLREPQARDG